MPIVYNVKQVERKRGGFCTAPSKDTRNKHVWDASVNVGLASRVKCRESCMYVLSVRLVVCRRACTYVWLAGWLYRRQAVCKARPQAICKAGPGGFRVCRIFAEFARGYYRPACMCTVVHRVCCNLASMWCILSYRIFALGLPAS